CRPAHRVRRSWLGCAIRSSVSLTRPPREVRAMSSQAAELARRLARDAEAVCRPLSPPPNPNNRPPPPNPLLPAPHERSLQFDLVRLDRTVSAAGCVGSRDPRPSTPTQRAAAQIPEAIGLQQR